jgi:hypothetical protein
MWPCIMINFLIIKPTRCTNFSNFFLEWNYMFRTVPLSIIRSSSLYTQQWYMSYRFADSLWAGSGWNSCPIHILLYDIPLLCVQWKTPDDGQRNCPKHVEFHAKNKFEKLVHLVGFIIRKSDEATISWKAPYRNSARLQTGFIWLRNSTKNSLLWEQKWVIGFLRQI